MIEDSTAELADHHSRSSSVRIRSGERTSAGNKLWIINQTTMFINQIFTEWHFISESLEKDLLINIYKFLFVSHQTGTIQFSDHWIVQDN